MPISRWRKLGRRLGLPVIPPKLMEQAFRHGSAVREAGLPGTESNQRLEFLGDAVLDLVVAEELYRLHPDWSEGELTRHKAGLVRATSLAETAQRLGLGEYMILGHGEEESGGRSKPSLLAEVFEALVGVVYLSVGLEQARQLILSHLPLAASGDEAAHFDHKSRLQELVQSELRHPPSYVVVGTSGPPHALVFTVQVRCGRRVVGEGTGTSKRAAEQEAAAAALAAVDEWLPALLASQP